MEPDAATFPTAPPAKIDLPAGLQLAKVSVTRTEAVARAVTESRAHLQPWMAWAAEPATTASIGTFLAMGEELFEQRRDFAYSILDPASGSVVGGCGLHGRLGRTGLEIGYWVHVDWVGRGVATEAARALTTAAFGIDGIERVRIHCEEANARSARVPAKLGYRCLGLVVPDEGPCTGRSTQEWMVERADWIAGVPEPTS
ncbi:MAG: GNAT family N-acetyltransferase [Acidimicrobiales bacterium]|nr:GNAT family N-acetyltransferase [Acidimicrobiales bacterium]